MAIGWGGAASCWPLRFTSRPGRAMSRVRMVRATVSSSSGVTSPRMAVQRIRLWASTAHCSQAELAWKLPGGDVFESGAFFEVADRELDDGVVAVELVER